MHSLAHVDWCDDTHDIGVVQDDELSADLTLELHGGLLLDDICGDESEENKMKMWRATVLLLTIKITKGLESMLIAQLRAVNKFVEEMPH